MRSPIDPIDVDRVRADTPATADRTLLNHAGASPSPTPVLDVVVGHLRSEALIGGYEAEATRRDDIDAARRSIASLLSCAPTDVAFASSATDAWERAFWAFPWRAGDIVLTCRSEYVTNVLNLLAARDRFGIEVRVVDDDATGAIDVDDLRTRLEDPAVRLVAMSHVPTQGGLVNPAAEVGATCRSAGVPFLLDACQSAGQIPLDVDELGCDVLTATGRKYLRGPRGTGFLFMSGELADRLRPASSGGAVWTGPASYRLPDGAVRFESYERSIAGVLGLGAAVDYALELGLDAIEDRVTDLADRLRRGLSGIDGVAVRDLGSQRCGIVTFTVDGVDPIDVRDSLGGERVHVWTTGAAFARIDLGSRGIESMVRASAHYVNTNDEIDRTIGLVSDIAVRQGR
ncbi:MAG TPA: aminotransferase class V-fold PLP-dependent enzyme [Microthrixaceae bacterium]|jgi:selenocysteine lyase/cysteine desulfurase|nr:aminotransferase class V-fold PLP-dependent enzyme [Microthrixaceae bacterium]